MPLSILRDRKQVIYQGLNQELVAERKIDFDKESRAWLEAELISPLPEYD